MSNAIKIDVQSNIKEFDVLGLIVKADTSDEAIGKMLNVESDERKAIARRESEKIKNINEENFTSEDFQETLSVVVSLYDEIYAEMFSSGTFEQVYNKVGSIVKTVDVFDQMLNHITKEVEEAQKKTQQKRNKQKMKYAKQKTK